MELLEDEGVVPEDVEEDLGVEEVLVVFVVEFDVEDSHSFCCRALAVASSAAVQFAARHSATAVWKAVLLQTQVVLVASVQVSVDVEFDKQPEMQLSTDWADTPTAITKRVAKTRRGLTIIACW